MKQVMIVDSLSFMLVSGLLITSVDFQETTQHYIPADAMLCNHCCENQKSYMKFLRLTVLKND
jgi:hypothetical protein